MKLNIYKHLRTTFALMLLSGALVSCEDLLDQEPPSYIVPEDYYKTEQQVQACANKFYTDLLPAPISSIPTCCHRTVTIWDCMAAITIPITKPGWVQTGSMPTDNG